MISEILKNAIESVENSATAFCKFLSANDTGATGGHQSGILVSVSAKSIMFSEKNSFGWDFEARCKNFLA